MDSDQLKSEAERATRMLGGKTVQRILRHRQGEALIEFKDGTRLFIDTSDNGVELSITDGSESRKQEDLNSIADRFPNVAGWTHDGWIELGPTDWSRSFIRVMDEGGLVWEGKTEYSSIEDALEKAEQAIDAWHNGDLP